MISFDILILLIPCAIIAAVFAAVYFSPRMRRLRMYKVRANIAEVEKTESGGKLLTLEIENIGKPEICITGAGLARRTVSCEGRHKRTEHIALDFPEARRDNAFPKTLYTLDKERIIFNIPPASKEIAGVYADISINPDNILPANAQSIGMRTLLKSSGPLTGKHLIEREDATEFLRLFKTKMFSL